MLFQSVQYLILLICAMILIRYVKSDTMKKVAILILSAVFYAYGGGWQTLLFAAVVLFSYGSAFLLQKNKNKVLFAIVLTIAFMPLFIYKYIPFLISEVFGIDNTKYVSVFVLPIGISFYTFQAVGYLIDVYRGKMPVVKNLLTFGCFISFFPQLVAGPIERAETLVKQVETFKAASREDYSTGFRYVLLGLSLKLLVAETMAAFVNPVFNNIYSRGGLTILIATVCFGIQIYCDFNGYTLIAIGSAKMMGINLMKNFDHPYNANSVSDFWRRWHISLTTWFRDYVYIPLGGNRKGKARTVINSLTTFTLSGIWHGANWTYLVWGFANGAIISLEKIFIKSATFKIGNKFLRTINYIWSFCVVNLLWIFFRANNISEALHAFKQIFTRTVPDLMNLTSMSKIMAFYFGSGWNRFMIFPFVVSVVIYFAYEYGKSINIDLFEKMHSKKIYVRWIIYTILICATLYFGQIIEQSAFVYFRF